MWYWYPSERKHVEVASGEFGGDDGANERRGAEAAAEEDTSDAVTATDQLNALHQVQYQESQPRTSHVFALKLACV